MNKVEGIIFDWAGTTVDFGCFAPVNVFIDIFKEAGIDVTMAEAREPMGMLKIDHIRAMLNMPRISAEWERVHGRSFDEQDVHDLYKDFEPALLTSLGEYTDPIPEVVETVQQLREQSMKIGSTTGYTQSMMDIVIPNAERKGYSPDFHITADATESYGRPFPYMIYRNMEALKLSAAHRVVKVGDTLSDIAEARNAGIWAVGVIIGSSEMGLSKEGYDELAEPEREAIIERTNRTFKQYGADFTIRSMGELPQLLKEIDELLAEGIMPGSKSSTLAR